MNDETIEQFRDAESALRNLAKTLGDQQEFADQLRQAATQAETLSGELIKHGSEQQAQLVRSNTDNLAEIRERLREEVESGLHDATSDVAARADSLLAAVDDARAAVRANERLVADLHSVLYEEASTLGDCARDLRTASVSLQRLDPEDIANRLDRLGQSVESAERRQTSIKQLLTIVTVLVALVLAASIAGFFI